MALLLRGAVKDPRVAGAVIHAVKVSGDLRYAKIWVRSGEIEPSDARKEELLAALRRASGFLRRELGARLGIRYTPELSFLWDDTAETAARVETLLEEIREEDPGREEGP